MGKARKNVTQPEHRSSRCQRRRRTFGGNRFSKRASEVVEEQPILDVNIESGVNTTVNNSFCSS